jgi:dimethylargininase
VIAITRGVSPNLNRCELTHQARVPIDLTRAREQHAAYELMLRAAKVRVESQPPLEQHPDSVFVEDTAIVLDELAIITRPGVASRRGETDHIAPVLERYRPLVHINAPGTLEGGDVLRLGKRLLVGETLRTNKHGIEQLSAAVGPYGYTVEAIQVDHALHLKSACAALDEDTVLANPAWIDIGVLDVKRVLCVSPNEPAAANILKIEDTIVVSAAYPETTAMLKRAGYNTKSIVVSELHKAEAGLTCMSLLITD